jgi:hypothetical protein
LWLENLAPGRSWEILPHEFPYAHGLLANGLDFIHTPQANAPPTSFSVTRIPGHLTQYPVHVQFCTNVPRSKESLFSERRQPRRKDKPVIRAPEIELPHQTIATTGY